MPHLARTTTRRLVSLWARRPPPPCQGPPRTRHGCSAAPADPPPPGTNVTAPQLMTEGLYSYLLDHTRESEVLRRLRADTVAFGRDRNLVSVDTGALLAMLVRLSRATRAIEVGVFTGYSSIAIAAALPTGGTLIACEKDERPLELARLAWQEAGVAEKIDLRLGDAHTTLASLLTEPNQPASYDFAFIDADKRGYAAHYEACLRLVKAGGVVAIDNLLWYGRVADATDTTPATVAVRDLNAALVADDRIDFVLVPVGDGVGLCWKR